jgi:hypothetical protein
MLVFMVQCATLIAPYKAPYCTLRELDVDLDVDSIRNPEAFPLVAHN